MSVSNGTDGPIYVTPESLAGDSFRALHASYMDAKGKLNLVTALHKPFKIYTDDCCNAPGHESGDDDTIDIPDVGTVCEGGFMYEICRECCGDGDNGQSEECASYHKHGKDLPICSTAALL